jgi:glycosyltransferase involved in cell wall biosynthesis
VPERPFVSVIVPTFERRELLELLLQSLAAQTYPAERMEVLVVDNSSRDGTREMVAVAARNAPYALRYFLQNNRGPALSRQHGLEAASGAIVAFTDSDCVASPGWIEAGVSAFGPGVGLVQGRTIPNPEQPRRFLERTIEITHEGPLYETCNVFYRRAAALEAGGFSGRFEFHGEDTELAWAVKRAGHGSVFEQRALIYHHVFPVGPLEWLALTRHVAAWPPLVKRVPELRGRIFCRYFLLRFTALFDLGVLGSMLAVAVHPAAYLLWLPYVAVRYSEHTRFRAPWIRAARVLLGLPRGLAILLVLAWSSLRHRSLVI